MKFYFSGTGNSLYVSKSLSKNDELISIAKIISENKENYEFELKENEAIGIIFPVYAWAPPKMVMNFITKLKFKNYNNNYIYFVATCGENIGDTSSVITKALGAKGLKLNSGFSITMPNNYVIMGDVYSEEKEKQLLKNTDIKLQHINKIIEARKEKVFEIVKGPFPKVLTTFINPIFQKSAVNTAKFYANEDCISCGLCEKICNSNTIKLNGKPSWGKECTGCLACLHICPTKAINYGKGTIKKGRYIHPLINKNEMKLR